MFNLFKTLFYIFRYRSLIIGNVSIGRKVWIRYSFIKGNITIGNGSTIYRSNLEGNIIICENCSITGPFTFFHSKKNSIFVGDGSAIAPGTLAITIGHDRSIQQKSVRSGGLLVEDDILIGSNVWIGAGSRLLGGSSIQNNVTAAAGAVLIKGTYLSDSLYAGVPAKQK